MDELQRTLHLLVHDLRSPLGIATGCMRLLRDNDLLKDEERRLAWTHLGEALRRMSTLFEDALVYVDRRESPAQTVAMPAGVVSARLAAALGADAPPAPLDASIAVSSLDGLVEAVRVLQQWVTSRHTATTAVVELRDDELRVLLCRPEARRALRGEPSEPVDPWRGGAGLALVSSIRAIGHMGGRVWTTPGPRPGLAIGIPCERGNGLVAEPEPTDAREEAKSW